MSFSNRDWGAGAEEEEEEQEKNGFWFFWVLLVLTLCKHFKQTLHSYICSWNLHPHVHQNSLDMFLINNHLMTTEMKDLGHVVTMNVLSERFGWDRTVELTLTHLLCLQRLLLSFLCYSSVLFALKGRPESGLLSGFRLWLSRAAWWAAGRLAPPHTCFLLTSLTEESSSLMCFQTPCTSRVL